MGPTAFAGSLENFRCRKPSCASLAPPRRPFIARKSATAKPVFLLGRDTRQSGQWIAQTFAEGAALEGVQVLDAGVTSTPSIAYLVPKKQMMGGVMISASHNPAEFNGIKLFSPLGRKCPDAWERLIEKRVTEIAEPQAAKVALRKNAGLLKDYLDFLKRSIPARERPSKG